MWQRFTERARRVILLGQEEADKMRSGHVGTEHLLLGLARETDGAAASVLRAMDVAPDAVREATLAVLSPGDSTIDAPKLTPKAKRVLELAADEARRMRHNYIGTEHLLLALLRERDGTASSVLRGLGLNLETTRVQVKSYLEKTPAPDAATANESSDVATRFRVTPDVSEVLDFAAQQSRAGGRSQIEIADLLCALCQNDESARLLREVGADVEALRARLQEL